MEENRLSELFDELRSTEDLELFREAVTELIGTLDEFKHISQRIQVILAKETDKISRCNTGINNFIYSYLVSNGPAQHKAIKEAVMSNFSNVSFRAVHDSLYYLRKQGLISYDSTTRSYTG